MIVFEIWDDEGDLITRCFSFPEAKRYKERRAREGVHNLHTEKIFCSEEREIRPIKKYKAISEVA